MLTLSRRQNGNTVVLGTHTLNGGAGPGRLHLETEGSLVRVKWNAVTRIEVSDGTVLSGTRAGLVWWGAIDPDAKADNFEVTGLPPAVTLTAPLHGASFVTPASIPVAALATDADGSIARVAFVANEAVIGTLTAPPYAMTYGAAGAGSYLITAIAYDNDGNSTLSAPRSVTVCSYGVAVSAPTLPVEGGAGTATVTTQPGCPWTAHSNADFIGASASGAGSGPMTYTVLANPGASARTGSFTVAGHTINLLQAGSDPSEPPPPPPPSCNVTVSQASPVTFVGGGAFRTDVLTPAGCSWTAASDVPWITVSPTSGTGPASLTYAVPLNDGPERRGHLTVNNVSIDVQQAGSDGSYEYYYTPPLPPWCIIFQEPECFSAECGMVRVCIPEFEAPRAPVWVGPPQPRAIWPSVAVNCRPVEGWAGYLGDHCYLMVRVDGTTIRYIQSGPENRQAPWGRNIATDQDTLDLASVNNPYTWYGRPVLVSAEDIQCLGQAVLNWNAANIQYEPLGDNSNYFASWALIECSVDAHPSPLARNPGWRRF